MATRRGRLGRGVAVLGARDGAEAAARALQITVHDHVVVAGDQVASLRALGLM